MKNSRKKFLLHRDFFVGFIIFDLLSLDKETTLVKQHVLQFLIIQSLAKQKNYIHFGGIQ